VASVRIELDERPILAAFERIQAAGRDTKPLWDDVGEYLQLATRFRFDTVTAPDGTPWEPLDPAYQRRKKRRQDEILVLDAFLRDTLAAETDSQGLEFGSALIYAATHQFGDPERGIPARPFLGLSEDDKGEILRLAREHLDNAIF